MNKLALCFIILLIHSSSSKDKEVTYTFNLEKEKITKNSSGVGEDEYKINLKIIKPIYWGFKKKKIYDGSIAIDEDTFNNPIKLDFICPGKYKGETQIELFKKEKSNSSNVVDYSTKKTKEVKCIIPEKYSLSELIYMKMSKIKDEWNLIVDLIENFQVQYEFTLRAHNKQKNEFNIKFGVKERIYTANNKEDGRNIEDELNIVNNDNKKLNTIIFYFKCPNQELSYKLIFKKENKEEENYKIQRIKYPRFLKSVAYNDDDYNELKSIVLCDLKNKKDQLENNLIFENLIDQFSNSKELKFYAQMIVSNEIMLEFKLNNKESIGEDLKKLELEIAEKQINKDEKNKTYKGEIEIDNKFSTKMDTITIIFKCPNKQIVYQLTFEKKDGKNFETKSIKYFYFERNKYIKEITKVFCPIYSHKDYHDTLNLYRNSIDNSSDSKELEIRAEIFHENYVKYKFELTNERNKENRLTLTMRQNDDEIMFKGSMLLDNNIDDNMKTIFIYFKCPPGEIEYELMFKKEEQPKYEIHSISTSYGVYYDDEKDTTNSVVSCPANYIKRSTILYIFKKSIAKSSDKNGLALVAAMTTSDKFGYTFKLKNTTNKVTGAVEIELEIKEERIDKQEIKIYKGYFRSDKTSEEIADFKIDFKCPFEESKYQLIFKKNEQTNYEVNIKYHKSSSYFNGNYWNLPVLCASYKNKDLSENLFFKEESYSNELALSTYMIESNKIKYTFTLQNIGDENDKKNEFKLDIKQERIDNQQTKFFERIITSDGINWKEVEIEFKCPYEELKYRLTFKNYHRNNSDRYIASSIRIWETDSHKKYTFAVLCNKRDEYDSLEELEIRYIVGNSEGRIENELSIKEVKVGKINQNETESSEKNQLSVI